MPIYTKKGDFGKTSILNSKNKVWKDSIRTKACGAVDELNSYIGVIIFESKDKDLDKILVPIQNNLLFIGSYLADKKGKKINLSNRIDEIEKEIDEMTKKLPELHNFIIPGGGSLGAKFHFARTIARRCEREVVTLFRKEKFDSSVLSYLNRLSDLLFTLARLSNYRENKKEIVWKNG